MAQMLPLARVRPYRANMYGRPLQPPAVAGRQQAADHALTRTGQPPPALRTAPDEKEIRIQMVPRCR